MPATDYVFADAPATANATMLGNLAAVYDRFSTRRLQDLFIPEDARCLVIAVGASRIASRLADRAPHGTIIATDIKPPSRHDDARIRLIRHDLLTDPLPAGPFHVIHIRLLLAHLPQRVELLANLAAALAPGGVLIVEEFEPTWATSVLASPNPDADRLFTAYHNAFGTVLRQAGTDPTWGRHVHAAMLHLGLDTDTVGHTTTWAGGTPGCLLPHATAAALKPKLITAGMPETDIDAFRTLLLDPRLRIKGNLALSTIGRRPH